MELERDRVYMKILIIDDEPTIRDVLRYALEQAGYQVCEAGDGRRGLEMFRIEKPDMLILDIMMPYLDGTEVCREIRKSSQVPILFLTARDEEIDRVLGLELGGDDYMSKPFSPRELVARVKAIARRVMPEHNTALPNTEENARSYSYNALRIDGEAFKAYWLDKEVTLTVTEFGIIRTLIRRPGKVFTRDNLMDQAYGLNKVVSDRTIDSHVRRVRSKFAAIGAVPIETVHGFGYKLGSCEA